MCTCTPQTHIVEYKGRGAPCGPRCYQPQGPKNTTKITHLGINRIVITSFTNDFY